MGFLGVQNLARTSVIDFSLFSASTTRGLPTSPCFLTISDFITFQMSLFGKIFGGKKQEVAPSTQDAIQKLRETEEMLIKKQDFLEKKIKDVS